MTLVITDKVEAQLRRKAEREQTDVNSLANDLLAEALANDPDELTEAEVAQIRAGIRRGLEAAVQGKERSIDEYAADIALRRAQRHG